MVARLKKSYSISIEYIIEQILSKIVSGFKIKSSKDEKGFFHGPWLGVPFKHSFFSVSSYKIEMIICTVLDCF